MVEICKKKQKQKTIGNWEFIIMSKYNVKMETLSQKYLLTVSVLALVPFNFLQLITLQPLSLQDYRSSLIDSSNPRILD